MKGNRIFILIVLLIALVAVATVALLINRMEVPRTPSGGNATLQGVILENMSCGTVSYRNNSACGTARVPVSKTLTIYSKGTPNQTNYSINSMGDGTFRVSLAPGSYIVNVTGCSPFYCRDGLPEQINLTTNQVLNLTVYLNIMGI